VTGASDTLDPILAAEAGIAGSKHLIASVANDLSQQERWLAHYRAAERRHARRLWFQEMIYQLELRRRRLVRWLKRLALMVLKWALSAAAFLSRTAVSLFFILRRATTACLAWLRPRAYALALTLRKWLVGFWTWALAEAQALARATGKAVSIGSAWIVHRSRILAASLQRCVSTAWAWMRSVAGIVARASLKGVSTGSSWIAATSRAISLSLRRELARLACSARNKAGHFSRASLATASLGFSWSKPTERHAGNSHRALVVRPGTALICTEPRRAWLPAIRAS
jgi:hypothetical protein